MVIFYLEKLVYGLTAIVWPIVALRIFFLGFLDERNMNGS